MIAIAIKHRDGWVLYTAEHAATVVGEKTKAELGLE